jgi:hypothetical protein
MEESMTGREIEALKPSGPDPMDFSKIQPGDEIFFSHADMAMNGKPMEMQIRQLIDAAVRAGAHVTWHESCERAGFMVRFE